MSDSGSSDAQLIAFVEELAQINFRENLSDETMMHAPNLNVVHGLAKGSRFKEFVWGTVPALGMLLGPLAAGRFEQAEVYGGIIALSTAVPYFKHLLHLDKTANGDPDIKEKKGVRSAVSWKNAITSIGLFLAYKFPSALSSSMVSAGDVAQTLINRANAARRQSNDEKTCKAINQWFERVLQETKVGKPLQIYQRVEETCTLLAQLLHIDIDIARKLFQNFVIDYESIEKIRKNNPEINKALFSDDTFAFLRRNIMITLIEKSMKQDEYDRMYDNLKLVHSKTAATMAILQGDKKSSPETNRNLDLTTPEQIIGKDNSILVNFMMVQQQKIQANMDMRKSMIEKSGITEREFDMLIKLYQSPILTSVLLRQITTSLKHLVEQGMPAETRTALLQQMIDNPTTVQLPATAQQPQFICPGT